MWLLPTLVGAIIGYFTNWLAIKMLFRPLEPVYIGRFRLPFTPGLLPAERKRLSRSIGETVSKELLSAEVFKARLSDPSLGLKLHAAMDTILEDLLSTEPREIILNLAGEAGPQASEPKEEDPVEIAGQPAIDGPALLRHSLGSIVSSPEFRHGAEAAAELAASNMANLMFSQIIDPESLENLVAEYAKGQRERADSRADTVLELLMRGGEGLFSPRTLKPLAEAAVSAVYDSLSPRVEALVLRPEIRSMLETQAMDLVRQAISRLNPLQRVIVGVASYERTIEETMPSTIADLASAMGRLLSKPEVKSDVVGSLADWLTGSRIEDREDSIMSRILAPALGQFFRATWEEGDDFASRLGSRYQDVADKKIGDVLPGFSKAVAPRLASILLPSEAGSRAFEGTISAFLAGFGGSAEQRNLGALLGIGPHERSALAGILSRASTQALVSQADRLVAALDIQAMVVERLDSLEMAEAERIILGVVNKELTWITILGGVLGAIIGLVQGLFSLI